VDLIMAARRKKIFTSVHELREIGLTDAALERLADADSFRSINRDRREALWEITTKDRPLPFSGNPSDQAEEEKIVLPKMTLPEHVVQDYASTSLSLKAHPVSFMRERLE